jgi:hypothetical protein
VQRNTTGQKENKEQKGHYIMRKKLLKALNGLKNMSLYLPILSHLFNRTVINNNVNEGGTLHQYIFQTKESAEAFANTLTKQIKEADEVPAIVEDETT